MARIRLKGKRGKSKDLKRKIRSIAWYFQTANPMTRILNSKITEAFTTFLSAMSPLNVETILSATTLKILTCLISKFSLLNDRKARKQLPQGSNNKMTSLASSLGQSQQFSIIKIKINLQYEKKFSLTSMAFSVVTTKRTVFPCRPKSE